MEIEQPSCCSILERHEVISSTGQCRELLSMFFILGLNLFKQPMCGRFRT